MKLLKRISLVLALVLTFACGSFGCAGADGAAGGYDHGADYRDETSREEEKDTEGNRFDGMTACAWDDNENYEYWLSMFEEVAQKNSEIIDDNSSVDEERESLKKEPTDGSGETTPDADEKQYSTAGKLYNYKKAWGLDSENRVVVTVNDGTSGVSGVAVICYDGEGNAVYAAKTNANGVAYLFPSDDEGRAEIANEQGKFSENFDKENRNIVFSDVSGFKAKSNLIEIMLVVDVTGSMGDEINFLKNQLSSVITRVSAFDKQTKIMLSMLFYRDSCDDKEFSYYDFKEVTDETGRNAQLAALKKQYADGGGDYPESVAEALEIAVNKQWSGSNSTKLIFHVLDAPPHEGQSYQTIFKKSVFKAAEKGIRICPRLASGADMLTEYLTRQEAILTGGTFVYVTDDSGNGNAHYDPKLPVTIVERLDSLMVRLIRGYHTGTFEKAVFWKLDTAPMN